MRKINNVSYSRRKYWSALWVSLLLSTIGSSARAQRPEIKFERYSTEDGMSQSSVLAIEQDSEGFMWFGTYGGLNRFDGYNFKTFNSNRQDPNSISENHVRAIIEESPGVFLIGTTNGLNLLYSKEEKFIHFKLDSLDSTSLSHNTIYSLVKDRDGDVWVGTWGGGLNRMIKTTDSTNNKVTTSYKFERYTAGEGSGRISSNKVRDMALDEEGMIWIATNTGLNKFDKKTGSFEVFTHDPNDKNSLSASNISSVIVDQQGIVWAATWGEGLNRFDPKLNTFKRFFHVSHDPTTLSNNIIMEIFCDSDNNIWVGTWGGGLDKVVKGGQSKEKIEPGLDVSFINYQQSKTDFSSISANSIYSIYEDQTGLIWVGTDWGGVNKFKKNGTNFTHIYSEQNSSSGLIHNKVFALEIDDDREELWIGTQQGLSRMNLETKEFESFVYDSDDSNSLSDNIIKSLLKDKKGNIWIGTLRGLNKYIRRTNSFKRYYIDISHMSATNVISIFEDPDGMIWLGTYRAGLFKLDPETDIFSRFSSPKGVPASLNNDIVWSIQEDQSGNAWIGTTNGGLIRYNFESEEFTSFTHDSSDSTSISHNQVSTIFIDQNNEVWTGNTEGFNHLSFTDSGTPVFSKYYEKDGLPSTAVGGITSDDQGRLWLSTPVGLSLFNPQDESFVNFSTEDGLQDKEFSIGAIDRSSTTGEIYAGGVNGFNVFQPNDLRKNITPPNTKIVDIRLFNESVELGERINDRVILDEEISALDEIKLSHKEYVLTLEFSALHYDSPSGNQYAYILEGFEEDWNYVENRREANYTNLPAGDYIFKVKASNADDVWNEVPTELRITIYPPWWATTWARIVFGITGVLAILMIYRTRVKYLRRKQLILQTMVRRRTKELTTAYEHLEEKQQEITLQNKEMKQHRKVLEEKQEEISVQNEQLHLHRLKLEELNEELINHRENLEKKVEERTFELKAAKIKAEESDRLKSSFLANMSHEVRTPMNAIIGFSTLLDFENLNSEKRKHFIRMIKNSGKTLVTLIDDILDMSKIEANQLDLFMESFSVHSVMKEIQSYYELKNEKGLEIIFENESSQEIPVINNDPTRFRQILNNLMNNAVKYTDKGYVKFGYRVEETELEVFVEDSGIGMEKGEIEHIFDYFYKVEKSEEKLYRGAGLGLAICKNLAELMNGSIRVESSPNKGTCFYLKLPLTPHQEVSEVKNHEVDQGDAPRLSGLNILIAEDEEHNYELLKELLSDSGATLHRAKNGEEAVSMVNEIDHDRLIVLMDIKMPVKDGITAQQEIKEKYESIPIIAVTAYAQVDDKKKMLSKGFDDYLSKPIDTSLLMKKISAQIRVKVGQD